MGMTGMVDNQTRFRHCLSQGHMGR